MILLAGPIAETLERWEFGLQGLAASCIVSDIDSLPASLARLTPEVLVLDLGLPGLTATIAVSRVRKSNPSTRIVAVTSAVCDETELALFRVGVRGCCLIDIDPQLLKRAVLAVEIGELWIRRSLTPRLLDDLGVTSDDVIQTPRAVVGRLADLTQREQQIAELIANGGSNKEIARRLAITERTVKAHLSEVFRKLNVGDRLKLALLVVNKLRHSPVEFTATHQSR